MVLWSVRSGRLATYEQFTLNLGARYEYETPRIDVNGVTNFFNFTKTNSVCNCPGVIEFGDKSRSIFDTQPYRFAPRIGFAWSPFGRQDLVVRGGYGIFYMGAVAGDPVWGGPGLGQGVNANWSADAQALSPAFILSAGFPLATGEPLSDRWGAVSIGQRPRVNPLLNYPHRPAGYSQQFNFGVQKQFGRSVFELGYLGNAAKRLPRAGGFRNYNEVRPENRGPGDAQARRPFSQFGDVLGSGEPIGSALYHAALVQVKHHFSRGLTFQTSYTFARQLDNLSYTRSDWARKADYGPSGLELRHRLVWSSAYDLPWGPGQKFLRSGPLANIIGGWMLGNIANLESGTPVNLSSVSNTCNCFNSGTQGVNLVGNPARTASGFDPRKDAWFNTAAFAAASPFTFGNAGPGIIRSPGRFNIDTT